MEATKQQKADIRRNAKYKVDIKEEWVQWATGDNSKTSLNDLTYEQAGKILAQQEGKPHLGDNWALFDKDNGQHKYILSLCIQMGLKKPSERHGFVADLQALSEWLKSERSPVRKKLMDMLPFELKKIIGALESITKNKYKK